MPKEINLNVSPYFDDFDNNKNYHRVLFKPGFPVQARELTTVQSILQNQIEKFGDHIFKEGSVVIPGQTNFNAYYNAVELNKDFLGFDVSSYIKSLTGLKIRGESSGIIAIIDKVLTSDESERQNPTLYVNYLSTNINDNESFFFSDGENLIVEENTVNDVISFTVGESFASVISQNSHSFGSSFTVSSGVYYLRGHFVNVETQTLILDQYTNSPNYKIGFFVSEEIINSFQDNTLSDNAKGFNNFTAPGADRLKITAILSKKSLDDDSAENFVTISEVQNGIVRNRPNNSSYNIINDKFAQRTFDESGDYYVNRFNVSCEESLNDNLGNNGIFFENGRTYQRNSPSEDLAIYEVSPGKAYIRGYDVEINSPTFLDVEKPRTTKNTGDESVIYSTGPTLALNRVSGSPDINVGSTYTLSLRDSRIGENRNSAAGEEIGLARIFDFALEEGSYNTVLLDLNRWDLSLFDIQTYTKITLNQPTTLQVPTHIVGNSSGATGFLKESVNNSSSLTLYNVNGKFLNSESFTIDGIRDNRVSLAATNYGISDVRSVFSSDSNIIFNGDTIQSVAYSVGICSITGESQGFSTVYIPGTDYFDIIKPTNILRFTNPLAPNIPNFSKVIEVTTDNILTEVKISGITSVKGVCEGKLPESNITVTDLVSLRTDYLPSSNNTLFTPLSKKNVSDIDLSNSSLVIRRNYIVSISNNSTENISAGTNEIFLPYDEERYSLMRSNGTIEPLSFDKFIISPDGKNLRIAGLNSGNDTGARLIATLRKTKIKSKIKKLSRVSSIIINKSALNTSGVGNATTNDGLDYGNGLFPYGTRVQDKEICLNVPDIIRVHGVFESLGISDPISPAIILSNINSASSTTADLVIGEQIVGKTSGTIAIVAEKISNNKISVIYLNDSTFSVDEVLEFKESSFTAIISSLENNSKNISNTFTFDNGQRNTFYDYGRLIRKEEFSNPQRKLKIYFEHSFYDTQDDGDITTANSYQLFDYKNDITYYDGFRMTDIIDIRPRVSDYVVTAGNRSPFEFDGRLFNQQGNSASNILASDENIILNYNFYLPRIDKIFLNKESEFTIQKGVPDENPKSPQLVEDSLEIAEIFLPPYLYDVNKASIQTREYKRYRMSDISKLETRIKNLEYYTTLSLLESETANLNIFDSDGISRFKSGFFVDNFTSLTTQEDGIGIRNSIDPFFSQLRPSHYTNSIDLIVATTSRLGIGITSNEDIANLDTEDLIGSNIKKSGDIITLNYNDIEYIKQPYATRVVNVQPYVLVFWEGSLDLNPSSDIWIDTVRLEPKTIQVEGNYLSTISRMSVNPQTGLGPVIWGSWALLGYGNPRWVDARTSGNAQPWHGGNAATNAVQNRFNQAKRTGNTINTPQWIGHSRDFMARGVVPTRGLYVQVVDALQGRSGTQLQVTERFDVESLGDSVVSVDIQPYMRSRNIQFFAHNLKPNAKLYSFFEGKDVTGLCFPKLIEIDMQSGTFIVGETITIRKSGSSSIEGLFRVAVLNHKKGKFNSPSKIYNQNPYATNQTVPSTYSSTSTLMNVDTASMAVNSQGSFYGLVKKNYILVGNTSGAIARVNNVRLISDDTGDIVGSFFIPDPNKSSNFRFPAGIKNFVITSDGTNNPIPGSGGTSANKNYFASGKTQKIQEKLISIRNADVSTRTVTQRRTEEAFTGLYIDPLAQSFACDEPTGVYLTKLDLYFQQKDPSIPVSCQIRTMDLGFPTQTVLPFSEVTVDSSDVIVTDNASIPTTFKFESPVYLEGNKEYAIVILSPSTSYFVWISSILGIDPEGQEPGFRVPVDTLTGERVTTQPILGSLFKSQNASTWTPSQFEDLKFTLHRAEFSLNPGTITLYNPDLTPGNNQVPILTPNSLDLISRRIRVGLSSIITEDSVNFPIGSTVIQQSTNSSAIYSGKVGICTGTTTDGGLSIDNVGIGYEYDISVGISTYNNIPLQNVLSRGKNATAKITVEDDGIDDGIDNGIITKVEIINGGYGYQVGDVLTVGQLGANNLGRNLRISIARIDQFNELILDNVNGNFNTGVGLGNTIRFINSSGNNLELNSNSGGNITIIGPIDIESDGLHFRVQHLNHGMHSKLNYVKISGVSSDLEPATINQEITNTFFGFLNVTNSASFETFEGLPVSILNPGYAIIQGEILKYTSVSGGAINVISRGIDDTDVIYHKIGMQILKYELDGVSLLRINRMHRLEDATISNPIGLDYYSIKINQNQFTSGNLKITDRRPSSTLTPALYFNSNKFDGGSEIRASQNMQFEVLTPLIETFTPSQTNISAQVRTVTGTSISGNEEPFIDKGFTSISLGEFNYFESPRLICSIDNERELLSGLPGNKSFNTILTLSSNDSRLTPCIDLTRTSIVTTSNRVNKITENTDYPTDVRIRTLTTDQNSFQYVTKLIRLQNPASSLKLYVTAHINDYADIRALYSIDNNENSEPIFELFPGFNNLNNLTEVIDPQLSDGRPDKFVEKVPILDFESSNFSEYEFTINNLPSFNYYRIKLILTSTNQSYVPKLKDIRAIALA